MNDHELKIRMSIDDHTGPALDEFGRAADKTTGRARDAMGRFSKATGDATGGVKGMSGAIRDAGGEVAGLIKAQIGLNAFKGLAQTIGSEWRKVADDIGKASREWQQFRQSLQGVASLEGKPNTNAFAASEVDRAERARVTPKEAQQFREAFLSKASLYVGDGPEAKMSSKDADEFQVALMEYAKDKGIGQDEMAGFAGGLLAQQKGKTTAAEMKTKAGKVFATLEASSAPVAHLLPMMTRAQAQGFSAEESSQVLAQMPEIAPEEEGTYMLRAVSALRERVQKGQGEELGLKKGMTPYQMLTTAVGNIQGRAAKGEDLEDMITRATNGEEVSGKALRGFVGQGTEGFERWRKVMQKVPDNQLDQTIAAERGTESGLQRAVDSAHAVEEARMGLRNDTVERRRQVAEIELMKGGKFEEFGAEKVVRGMLSAVGGDDAKGQMINAQAIRRARAELGESSGLGDATAATNKGATDALLRELIKRIEEQNEMMRKDRKAGADGPPPPMAGRPARQAVRP